MIPKLIIIFLSFLFGREPDASGTLAYYHQYDIKQVCEYRVSENWNPSLNCSWPCLVASIPQRHVGEYWLVALPDCRNKGTLLKMCHVVDCGSVEDQESLKRNGEVIEISGELARY